MLSIGKVHLQAALLTITTGMIMGKLMGTMIGWKLSVILKYLELEVISNRASAALWNGL